MTGGKGCVTLCRKNPVFETPPGSVFALFYVLMEISTPRETHSKMTHEVKFYPTFPFPDFNEKVTLHSDDTQAFRV